MPQFEAEDEPEGSPFRPEVVTGRGLQGVLLTLAPVLAVLLAVSRVEDPKDILQDPQAAIGAAAAAGMGIAGLIFPFARRAAQALSTLAILAASAAFVWGWYEQPSAILVGLLVAGGLLMRIWPVRGERPEHEDRATAARRAGLVALASWAGMALIGWSGTDLGNLMLAVVVGTSGVLGAHWWWAEKPPWRHWIWFLVGLALAGLGAGLQATRPVESLALMAFAPLGLVIAARPVARWDGQNALLQDAEEEGWGAFLSHPARAVVVTFAVLCLAGGLLLSLPAMSATPGAVPLVDALFTAVSAVCITGLVTLDIASTFSAVGQATLLLLFQVGGLGIMTFSTFALVVLGRRMSVRHEATAVDLLGGKGRSDLVGSLRRILWVTFAAEALGAAALLVCFLMEGDALGAAAWRAVFTAVSAFCHAGFALQSDSLVPYNDNPAVLHIISLMIVLGSLGPAVVLSLPDMLRQRRVSLHARVVVATTAVLLIGPTALIAMLEWGYSLAPLSTADKLHNAWFQAVVTRSAGFNSVDITAMHPATQLLFWGLMFMGGSPGSTAGGVKITTIAVLFLALLAAIRGTERVEVEGREIPTLTVYKSAAIVTIGLMVVFAAILGLLLTQELPLEMAIFEVFSALGTVGLSLGATIRVDAIGKAVLMVCMFIGRVGPLTLFLLLSEQQVKGKRGVLPREDLAVG